MKKLIRLVSAGVAVFMLNGCGGSGDDTPSAVTNFLLTYDDINDIYVGVAGIDYSCGPDAGITDIDGAFTFVPGDDCTFYDLDDTLSLSANEDELYISGTAGGEVGIADIYYYCDSSIDGVTDIDGQFIFDPFSFPQGDACTFEF